MDELVCDIYRPFSLPIDYGHTVFETEYSGGLTGSGTFAGGGAITGAGTFTYSFAFPDGPNQPGTLSVSGGGEFQTDAGGSGGSSGTTYTATPAEPCQS